MGDISLLPEDLRGKEDRVKDQAPTSSKPDEGGYRMHIPDAMVDEDIEIIEVDEGDLAAVLSDEPFMTRITYQLSLWIDQLKGRFLSKQDEAPPPKAPPQFFKPPKKGLVTSSPSTISRASAPLGSAVAGGVGGATGRSSALRARITPQSEVPRRVRVIKRVRKPVRVSLISADDLAVLTIDVSKRKWTLAVFIALFASVIAGGYFLIASRTVVAKERLAMVEADVASTRKEAETKLEQWKQYEDLESRIKLLQVVLGSHVVITRLFDFLEQNTLERVSYGMASWSGASGQLNLDVVADSFDDTGGQLIVMRRSPFVEQAESSGFAMTKDGSTGALEHITFQMALKLKADAFKGNGLEPLSSPQASSTAQATSTSSPSL